MKRVLFCFHCTSVAESSLAHLRPLPMVELNEKVETDQRLTKAEKRTTKTMEKRKVS